MFANFWQILGSLKIAKISNFKTVQNCQEWLIYVTKSGNFWFVKLLFLAILDSFKDAKINNFETVQNCQNGNFM